MLTSALNMPIIRPCCTPASKYVNKDGFTTNNVENFFGVFKKGMVGVYHFCGEQHLQRYLNEFSSAIHNRSGLGVERRGARGACA